jgi:hypothetical protein
MFPEYDVRAFNALTDETPSRKFRREYYESQAVSKPASTRSDLATVPFNVELHRASALAKVSRFFRMA